MNKISSDPDKWYLLVIDDPDFVSSKSVLDVLKDIIIFNPIKYTAFNDVYGGYTASFVEIEGDVIEINKLLELLPEATHFEWANFFLFNEYPNNWSVYKNTLSTDPFMLTSCTVRVVDGQYIYIYTPKQEMIEYIKSLSKYNIESIDVDLLSNLPYPE